MCKCGFERGGGTLGGLGDRDREKGDRDGWPALAGREASMAVTAVAIEVAVEACCPTLDPRNHYLNFGQRKTSILKLRF